MDTEKSPVIGSIKCPYTRRQNCRPRMKKIIFLIAIAGMLLIVSGLLQRKRNSPKGHHEQTSTIQKTRYTEVVPQLTAEYDKLPKMTLMLRTSMAETRLMYQFYCIFLRTTVLFWPSLYGDIALILDKESHKDHKFGKIIQNQIQTNYPDYKVKIYYETMPKNTKMLKHNTRPPGYIRQLWSTFFADLYSNDTIIAYMDTDVMFITPMTKEYLFDGKRLKVFGIVGMTQNWIKAWESSTHEALGLPMVANFMVTFPQLVYRDTYTRCREHIMKHLKVTNFEDAFKKFQRKDTTVGTINIIMSYAWYYEHDRYDWHLKVANLALNNQHLPTGHKIQIKDMIPGVVGVSHISDVKKWKQSLITPGYCLSMAAQGQSLEGCKSVTHKPEKICHFHENIFKGEWPIESVKSWCRNGTFVSCCQKAVHDHYKTVSNMANIGIHTVQLKRAVLVGKLANQTGIACEKMSMP